MQVLSKKLRVIAGLVGCLLFFLTFSISASASTETVLYTFTGTPDGSAPHSGLVRDMAGNLYGVTEAGGVNREGTVFELSRTSGGGWTETILHSFGSNGDGYSPGSGLTIDAKGNLYGTTIFGGSHVLGTVFELSPSSEAEWTETILFNFTGGTDGGAPQYGSLVFDSTGNLYGTTQNGGAYGYGVAFELSPSTGGEWTEKVLHDFADNATDGGYPVAVVFDPQGNLYGSAAQGGSLGRGVVFELSPSASGNWTETILHNFAENSSDGGIPIAGVVLHGGQIYGTTENGGKYSLGTVYHLFRTKTGWKEYILHNFSGGNDGLAPESTVVFDKAGNLYGTTYGGGAKGYGTVFELSPSTRTETILCSFTGQRDGGFLYFGVILDANGNLYGTTSGGGDGSEGSGDGVVFKLTP